MSGLILTTNPKEMIPILQPRKLGHMDLGFSYALPVVPKALLLGVASVRSYSQIRSVVEVVAETKEFPNF